MVTILVGIVVLGVLVFVHELGHYAGAKAMGVRVLKFSLGFGPELVGFTVRGTRYVLAAFPLGGFVKMAGDSPDSSEREGGSDEFFSKPWWARMLIAVSGPGMNLFFAFVACMAMYAVGIRFLDFESVVGHVEPRSVATEYGFADGDRIVRVDGARVRSWSEFVARVSGPPTDTVVTIVVQREKARVSIPVRIEDREELLDEVNPPASPPVVGSVSVGLPAYERGLKAGDRILSVDGIGVKTWDELAGLIHERPEKEALLVVERKGKQFEVAITPLSQRVEGVGEIGLIGISPPVSAYGTLRAEGFEVVSMAAVSTGRMLAQTYSGLLSLAAKPGQLGKSIAGPVTIVQMSGDQARRGLGNLLYFAAFVSIALVVVNLLPVPILDGGHVIFCIIEGVRGRALSIPKQIVLQRVGLAIVGALILLAFWVDFGRIIQRGRATLGEEIELKGGTSGEADTTGAILSE
ncbi:MAG: RIP metalloprotease RseP [Candidatus Eiseniibacteriota bacterium]|nr:MAG: RIP metalloprotease RseP [Candidatus Eisenbacteria bacterium]